MASKTQEQLLKEFGGLFDRGTTELSESATGGDELTQSLTASVEQLSQAASAMTPNAAGSAAATPAGTNTPGASISTTSGSDSGPSAGSIATTIPEEFGGLFDKGSGGDDLTQSLTASVEQLSQAASAMTPNTAGSAAATPAGTNTPGGSISTTGGNDSGPSAGSIASTFLESGFGIVPLITGLIGLFGGGSDAPPALQKYVMPSAISFESADTGSGLSASDFDQTGAPRTYSASDTTSVPSGSNGTPSGTPAAGSNSGSAPQITVNVQAMDAQSFMSYSSQIAQAVRGAMLNLSSLNDVVNEL